MQKELSFRDNAFTVTGGLIIRTRRLDRQKQEGRTVASRWQLTVRNSLNINGFSAREISGESRWRIDALPSKDADDTVGIANTRHA